MKRKIIRIDHDLCDGCGQCLPNCPEGALQLIDRKARVVWCCLPRPDGDPVFCALLRPTGRLDGTRAGSRAADDTAGVFAALVVIAVMAVIFNEMVGRVQDRIQGWKVVSR